MKLLIHQSRKPFAALSACVCATLIACAIPASAAVSDTVGYNTITCLANSDTIVGVPLRQSGSIKGALNGVPDTSEPGFATLTLSAAPSDTADSLAFSHYLQFTSGTKNGQYFTIGENSGTSVTIDLNGGNLDGVVGVTTTEPVATADTFIIAKYWTLDDLFPPAEATTAWDVDDNPDGHAIVASASVLPSARKTQLFFLSGGIEKNRSAAEVFYIANNAWQSATNSSDPESPDPGGSIILPDTYIVIRHPNTVTKNTTYTCIGEVHQGIHSIPIISSAEKDNDVIIGLPRPINIRLDESNLFESSAFQASNSVLPSQRKDLLIVFNNSSPGKDKTGRIFFHDGTNWLEATAGNAVSNNFEIPAGTGFVIRKIKSSNATVEWVNPATY